MVFSQRIDSINFKLLHEFFPNNNKKITVANGLAIDVQTGLTIPGVTYDAASILALITGSNKSTVVTDVTTLKLGDPFNNAAPNLKPTAGSPMLTGALFDFGGLTDSFFEKVAYKGAFDGTTDWTTGWAKWGL